MILVYRHELASVELAGRREVCCTNCGHKFAYAFTHRAIGKASVFYGIDAAARKHALAEARQRAERELPTVVAPKACPNCRRYQTDMVCVLARERYPSPFQLIHRSDWTLKGIGVFAFLTCLAGFDLSLHIVAGDTGKPLAGGLCMFAFWLAVVAVLLLWSAVQFVRRANYDPGPVEVGE